jgi:hypothetical protein
LINNKPGKVIWMPEKDDHFVLWLLCGIISAFVRELYSITAKTIGLQQHLIWNIASGIFVDKGQVHTPLGIIVGFLGDFVTGGIIGFLYGLFLEWRGNQHYIVKGIVFGMATWLLVFGMVSHMLPLTSKELPRDALSVFSSFIGHVIYGYSLALIYKILFKVKKPSSS